MRLTVGGWGWATLPAFIATVDAVALEMERRGLVPAGEAPTMTRAWKQAWRHPLRRWPCFAVLAWLFVHLCTEWVEPIRWLSRQLSRRWMEAL